MHEEKRPSITHEAFELALVIFISPDTELKLRAKVTPPSHRVGIKEETHPIEAIFSHAVTLKLPASRA